MDQYKEFCRLRDYRKPGVEVPQYTEAEAFAMALAKRHVSVLDGAIPVAEEFGDARPPNEGDNAFRNYAEILHGLKNEHAQVASVTNKQHPNKAVPKTPTTFIASMAARSTQ